MSTCPCSTALRYVSEQATKLIKQWICSNKWKDVPIVMLSAMDDMKIAEEALEKGASEYGNIIIQYLSP